ncbi:carbohydrate ABC transporter permease [Paenibacillus sp. J5C_2022]|uniref:carbohydrate ABC transporter permease n=1 Tax=Paenibacillus sp. J5C2022 TaxID=2977129 RepID=UPI0021D33146|nr:carbohydrate ABC transporter permease [Paenibacillus sp. J5C2022]MCU6707747.1 carbohydrate ABC transporter permease [Paenibacillus sp. J5C2022]
MKTYNEGVWSKTFDIVNYLFMIVLCVIMLYPLLNTFSVSISTPDLIAQGKISWYPQGFDIHGYKYIFQSNDILTAYKNTIVYLVIGTFLQLLLTSLFAYPLAVNEFILRKPLAIFVIITMVFNGGLIPTFLLMRDLQLFNTMWAIVLPVAMSAFNIIIFRTFFQDIPKELRESAYLDGANDIGILFRIYLPLSKPLMATFALFGAVMFWNMWFEPMIFFNDEKYQPIQLILRRMTIELNDYTDVGGLQRYIDTFNVNPKNIKMAAVIVTILPILFIYPLLQKHFVSGMMIGSVKG